MPECWGPAPGCPEAWSGWLPPALLPPLPPLLAPPCLLAGWCRKAAGLANVQATGAWQWWRPRARARICGACPHMSCAALVAAASGCLNGTQNAPPAGCRLSAGCPGARRRDAADEFFATSRTRQDMRGRATHIMCSSGGSGQRLP